VKLASVYDHGSEVRLRKKVIEDQKMDRIKEKLERKMAKINSI